MFVVFHKTKTVIVTLFVTFTVRVKYLVLGLSTCIDGAHTSVSLIWLLLHDPKKEDGESAPSYVPIVHLYLLGTLTPLLLTDYTSSYFLLHDLFSSVLKRKTGKGQVDKNRGIRYLFFLTVFYQ